MMIKKNKKTDMEKKYEEIDKIYTDIKTMREELLEKRPSHFSKKDVVNAFFASLLVGLTFVFKGSLVERVIRLSASHIFLIFISTILILTAQIYFISYKRVKEKEKRRFCQFWLKRLSTFYLISIIVSFYLSYMFGINNFLQDNTEIFKLVVTLSMPCAIGAAIPNLLKQY